MKLHIILSTSALFAGAFANTTPHSVHAAANLLARAMDPATMDPTKLSVLSVLKTAIPTTFTGTDIELPTGTAAPQWYKDLPADVMVALVQMYPATATAAAMSETAMSASASVSSREASQTTVTRTLQSAPTATKAVNGSLTTGDSSGASPNTTLSTGQPSPTQSAISTGAKSAVGAGRWSLVGGVGVAAVFCFFV